MFVSEFLVETDKNVCSTNLYLLYVIIIGDNLI